MGLVLEICALKNQFIASTVTVLFFSEHVLLLYQISEQRKTVNVFNLIKLNTI